MPTTEEVAATAAAALWVEQFTQASEDLKQNAAQAAVQLWETFDDWYNPPAVAKLAKQVSDLSVAAQQKSSGLSASYVNTVTAQVAGTRPKSMPRKTWTAVRNGADLPRVHTRPAQAYLRAVATGTDHQVALNLAYKRAAGTMMSDITLQDRQTMQKMLQDLGVVSYRRVIHPELSRTGTCGLCVVAASKPYNSGTIMPLHPPTCKCTVMPIIAGKDYGNLMNEDDLQEFYGDAGSNRREDLARTRYQVNEHGELGPVLTKQGDNFRDETRSWLEDDIPRARRLLAHALPMLEQMEARAESGEPHAEERLAYQKNLVEKLLRITQGRAA